MITNRSDRGKQRVESLNDRVADPSQSEVLTRGQYHSKTLISPAQQLLQRADFTLRATVSTTPLLRRYSDSQLNSLLKPAVSSPREGKIEAKEKSRMRRQRAELLSRLGDTESRKAWR